MLNWVLQHRVELTAISWLLTIAMGIPFVWMAFSEWRYKKQFRRQLRMSAVLQARFAVFDSWVRSGGIGDGLSKDVEMSLREDYRAAALKHGIEYCNLYGVAEEDAERDLTAVINVIKGKVNAK